MELNKLHDKFIAEGCNHFYIEGVGGPQSDDVEVLGERNGIWEICYVERGQKSSPLFSSTDKDEAIEYYTKHVLRIKHHHLVVMTRLTKKISEFKEQLTKHNIEFMQNDIPHYNTTDDIVYRLFVFGKSIFKVKELCDCIPFIDKDLK